MSDLGKTLKSLRQTSKGKLKYDKDWFIKGGVQGAIADCSSPPQLRFTSPQSPEPGFGWTESNQDEKQTKQEKNIKNVHFKETDDDKTTGKDGALKERLSLTEDVGRSMMAIASYEQETDNKTMTALAERRRLFEEHSRRLEKQAERQLRELYMRKEEEAQNLADRVQAQIQARSEEVKKKHQKLREHHKQHAKLLETKAEAHKRLIEEEERKRKEENSVHVQMMTRLQTEVAEEKDKLDTLLAGCAHAQYLPEPTNRCQPLMAQIVAKVDQIVSDAQHHEEPAILLQTVADLRAKAKTALDFAQKCVEVANNKGQEAEKQEAAKKAKEEAEKAAKAAADAKAKQAASASSIAASSLPKDAMLCVTEEAFAEYTRLQSSLSDVEKSYQPIVTDAHLKKYKFDLQKAVNTPVNAIAPTSGSHLRDKLQRLCGLLSGQPVDVGGRKVSTTDHPAAGAFVRDLLAKKIVKQGDEQVSSQHEAAFAIAAVTVGVWCEMPDLGDILLAHFHNMCPYIVPYYRPKQEGQTAEEYYKSQGYKWIDGAVEKQDKFLKRQSGIMRLYCALMVSTPPRGVNHPHPHGIHNAWLWLARVMNLEPRPDITATMTYDLLQVTGHALWKTYDKQFVKLLQTFVTDYLPKIKAVSPQGGPIGRLENYLQKCMSSANIPPPEGLLSPNFWFT